MSPDVDAGFLLPVDKPIGPTSHDIVARARRALGIRRVGHTGTLDPFASGLLLLCIGPATRLAEYLDPHLKVYRALVRLGASTDTDDRTGNVTARTSLGAGASPEAVERSVARQIGDIMQTPPAYSAKKIGGERMYAIVRRGDSPAVAPSPVRVHVESIRILSFDPPDLDLEVTCGTGTYIRAIARDIGSDLKCGAHLQQLRRTRIGPFSVNAAMTLDELDEPADVKRQAIDPLRALGHLPIVEIGGDGARSIGHGRPIEVAGAPSSGVVAIAREGRLLAVGEAAGGVIRPRKVFA